MLTWTSDMSLGIQSIDDQHKKLFELINKLQDAMSKGESRAVLGEIFEGLINYTVDHFGFEKNIFETHGYSEITEHLGEHDRFVKKMQDLQGQFQTNSNFMIGVDVMKFLTDWLVNHIQGEDRKYVTFFQEKGIQ